MGVHTFHSMVNPDHPILRAFYEGNNNQEAKIEVVAQQDPP